MDLVNLLNNKHYLSRHNDAVTYAPADDENLHLLLESLARDHGTRVYCEWITKYWLFVIQTF